MTRAAIIAGSLVLSVMSLAVEFLRPAPDSTICRYGGCRLDEIYDSLDRDRTPAGSALLILEDPANPLAWCTYGEILSAGGDRTKAIAAFDRATALGPGVAAVWMRAANFDFTHDRREAALRDAARILTLTDGFDGIVFSYLPGTGLAVPELLGTAVPAQRRAAQAFLAWLRAHGTDQDMLATWTWMTTNGLGDDESARALVHTLWDHKAYRAAQDLWMTRMGPRRGASDPNQHLFNTRFTTEPDGTPFDWTLTAPASVEVSRLNGLVVRFLGTENVDLSQVHQSAILDPGRYRFSAEVASEGLTTDARPFFRIVDVSDPHRLDAATSQVEATTPGSVLSVDFTVPPNNGSAEVVDVQLRRRPSLRFDNKIGGTLHVRDVSLVQTTEPANRDPKVP